METENPRTSGEEPSVLDTSGESVNVPSAPLVFPEVVRKSKPKVSKKPHKKRHKKHVKTEPKMTKEEMLTYFSGLQSDPNFGLLPFPRFMIEQNPMVYAGEDPKVFAEKMKRLDFLTALENAETEEERKAIIAKREKELEHQTVPAYHAVAAGGGGNPFKG